MSVETVPAVRITEPGQDMSHVVCCDDEELTMCGLVMVSELVDDIEITCAVCEAETYTEYCPRYGRCACV